MKTHSFLTTILASASILSTACVAQQPEKQKTVAPEYISEAPLPEGWPKPGPFNQVTEKTYPAYRAAVTPGTGQNFAFLRLFQHIKRNDIPMTSPVEMKMENEGNKMKMTNMSFLYQNTDVGETGQDGKMVEVRDVPKIKTLSYTFQGKQTSENVQTAKRAIQAELDERNLKASGYRILGYNGPGVPASKKTWELQAILR